MMTPDAFEPPSQSVPLDDLLTSDGVAWREQLPIDVGQIQADFQRRRVALKVGDGTERIALAKPSAPSLQHRYRAKRTLIWGTAALLITLAAIITVAFQQQPVQPILRLAPPPIYYWSATNVDSNLSPQQAFERGVTLTPCKGQPAQSNRVSWIGTNPHFGLALIQSTCPEETAFIIFAMNRGEDGMWRPGALYVGGSAANVDPQEAMPVPNWLALPKNTKYREALTVNENPATLRGWYNIKQIYMGGRISEPVTPVSPGQSVVVAGKQGQLVQDGDITTVLVPLSSTETYFFTATASPQTTLTLAAAMLTHIDILDSL